jgi:peptide/nickel transport system substrate-binding protein
VRLKGARLYAVVLAGAFVVGPAGVSASQVTAPRVAMASGGSTLTISAADGETWPCSFNPFNPNTYFFSLGTTNEELYYIDSLTGQMTPWLATSYKWSDDAKVLTWTIRQGVKWSNGQPMTAADVAFTFNLIKKDPSLDLNAIDPLLVSVTQSGADQVVMRFKEPAATEFYYIADQVAIVPESIWGSVKDPLTFQDADPVGTGPYLVGACTPENIEYVKNTSYWQPGKPKFDKVEVPAILTNSVANELLANGTAQWGGQYIPDINKFYMSRNPANRDWSPPVGVNGIYINLKDPLLSDLAVRQAMAYGVNRALISKLGEGGEAPPANQAAVLLPEQQSWYNSSLAAKYNDYNYDPAKAISVLEKAGYKRGSGGTFENSKGDPLAFTIIDVGAYSDAVADVQIFDQEMAQIGIKMTQENLSTPAVSGDKADGKFQLVYGGPPQISVDGPYGILRGLLYSANSAPIGQSAASNFERYSSPREDALINGLASATSVPAQEQLVKQMEAPMLEDVPFLPLTEATAQNENNSAFASGWPTPSDPYANPSPTTQPDEGVVLVHLVPKG